MTDESKRSYAEAISAAFEKTEQATHEESYRLIANSDGKPSYNISSMLTTLVQETGRFTERYASDIIISANSLMKSLDEPFEHDGDIFLFGMRENGVDHYEFVLCNMDTYAHDSGKFENYYRKIYAIRLDIVDSITGKNDEAKLVMKEIRKALAQELWSIAAKKAQKG